MAGAYPECGCPYATHVAPVCGKNPPDDRGVGAPPPPAYASRRTNPGETDVATIPKILQPHIDTAFPEHVCLVATVLPNGFAQVTPRGSTMVFDDDHIALWERGKGST